MATRHLDSKHPVARPVASPLAWALLALTFLAATPAAHAADKSMWIWSEAALIRNNPAARSGAINFMKAQGIGTAYLFTSWNILFTDTPQYRTMIADFHANGIEVYALDGDPGYTVPNSGAVLAAAGFQGVLAYNATSAPNERFDGFNADVEPWALPDWNTNPTQQAQWYLDLATMYMQKKADAGATLKVGPDLAPFFDIAAAFPALQNITYNGNTKPFYQHVQDIYDYITLMDYRDFALGPNGIVNGAAAEMAYAATIGKPVVIGVETQNVTPDVVTFYQEGPAAMQTALDQTEAVYGSQPEFDGFALHHYGALLDFLPPPAQPGDLDGDGFVGITDLNLILSGWNQNVIAGDIWSGDTDGDGFLGIADLNNVLSNWNAGTPPPADALALVPEPASGVTLACLGFCLRRRRPRPATS